MLRSEQQVNSLLEFLGAGQMITELNISWSNFNANQLCVLFKILETNKTMRSLDLSFIKMSNEHGIEAHFTKFLEFIKGNSQLMHLNLTSIDLPDALMLELIQYLKRSMSLHSVHLCGNSLSDEAKKLLDLKLKPKHIELQMARNSAKHKLVYCMNNYLKHRHTQRHE
jgi:hypothetical protein